MRHQLLRLLGCVVLTLILAGMILGCATTDPDAESDLPWNAQQPWEGTMTLPGMEGY